MSLKIARIHFVFILNDEFYAIDKLNTPEADIVAKSDPSSKTNTAVTPRFRIDSDNCLLRITSIETSENTSLNEMIENYMTSTDPNDATLRHALSFLRRRKCLHNANGGGGDFLNGQSDNIRFVMHNAMTHVYTELNGNIALRVELKGGMIF